MGAVNSTSSRVSGMFRRRHELAMKPTMQAAMAAANN